MHSLTCRPLFFSGLVWVLEEAKTKAATAESRVNNVEVLNNIFQMWWLEPQYKLWAELLLMVTARGKRG